MHRRIVAAGMALLVACAALAQDPLSDGDKAFRSARFKTAARFYAAAAAAEPDPAKKAEIQVKLALAYYNARERTKAEDALAAALGDAPQLELVPEFYDPEFLKLFAKVKAKVAAASAAKQSPGSGPIRTGNITPTLTQIRQQLAGATDNAAVEALLPSIATLELSAPASALPDVLDVKAEVFERLGRTAESLELRGRAAALKAAAQVSPGTSPVPLEALLDARRMLASGRPQDAISLLKGILDAQPSCVPAFEVLAEAYLDAGKLDEAYNALRTALLGNEKPSLLLELGEVELRRDHPNGARDAFRRVVEVDPGNDRAWAALGLLAARAGDIASARDSLDKALQANGTLFEARVVRAQITLADGHPDTAVQELQRALQVRPGDPWATGWLGQAYLAAGDNATAAARLRDATKAGAGRFALALAEALRRLGSTDEALKVLDAAPQQGPEAAILRARCLLDAGKPTEAEAVLTSLVAASPNNATAHYLLGYAMHAQGRWREAVKELTVAASLPGAPPEAAEAVRLATATQHAQEVLDSALTVPAQPPRR
jgi:tetratricopeptide (TPR) repeat protein